MQLVSDGRGNPQTALHLARDCQPLRKGCGALGFVVLPVDEVAFLVEIVWAEAGTELNFCSTFMRRSRNIARSRRRNGWCEFSARLLSQWLVGLARRLPIALRAAP